jgi:hypothetical protein
VELLHRLADELRETFSERGHAIEKALSGDRAFRRTRRSQSSLVRDLVLDGLEAAAARIGLGCIPVVGGSRDIQAFIGNADCRFRVLKAGIDPDTGEYEIVASSDAIMTITDSEPDAFYPTERWVLGYTVDADGMLAQIFAAKVDGLSSDVVPRLLLGTVTELGAQAIPPSPNGGFRPLDEDELDGMEELENGVEGTGMSAGA